MTFGKVFLEGGLGGLRRLGQVGVRAALAIVGRVGVRAALAIVRRVGQVGQKNEEIGRCIEKNTNFVLYNNKLKTKNINKS